MNNLNIRRANKQDQEWIREIFRNHWASETVVTRGKSYHADDLHCIIAENQSERVGLLTYRCDNDECEIMTLNSLHGRQGIGTVLMKEALSIAEKAG